MKKVLCLLIFVTLLAGCSVNASTKPKDVNEEFHNKTVEVLKNYSDFVENGKPLTDEVSRKNDFYFNHYNKFDGKLTTKESEIVDKMILLKLSVEMFNTSYKNNETVKKAEWTEQILKQKEELNKILGK